MLPTTKRAAAQPATMCVHTTRMDAETHHTHRTPITAPSTPPKAVHAYIPCLRGLTSSLLGSWRAALLLAYVATTSASPGRRGTELGNTSSASSRHLQATADTPNVLLFVADDLGVGDIKASGYMDENGKSTTRVSTAHLSQT